MIVTVKLPLALLPCASVAVQLTGVAPTGKAEPDAGAQIGEIDPSTRSEAVAMKVTVVPGPVASFVIDAGSGRIVTAKALVEVCGVAPDGTGFMATTGAGEIVEADGTTRSEPDYVWDNHMLRIEQSA